MTDSAASSLLSPDGVALRDPAQVERTLAELWKPAAHATGETDAHDVTRVCLANLVVVAQEAGWNELLVDLSDLSTRYPTRTIVLLLEPADSTSPPAASGVRASVSALCHVPLPGRPQVCSEQIVLRSSYRGPCDLDRTVLTMLAADVPTIVWWTIDPAAAPHLFSGLRSLANRMVLDAGLTGLAHLDPSPTCAVRELGWVRTYRWRQLIAGLFDECGSSALRGVDRLLIDLEQPSTEDRIDALWLIAFLAGQLGWQPGQRTGEWSWQLRCEGRMVQAEVRCRAGERPGLSVLHIACAASGAASGGSPKHESTFEIARCASHPEEYRATICDAHICRMPRSVQMLRHSRGDAMAAAMRGRPIDRAFERAVPIARWLATK